MDPIIGGAAITGAAALAEGLASTAFSISESSKQRRWQERMSNTAHQREMADLRAAGLNPILTATRGGPGASTPPGSTAQFNESGAVDKAMMAARQIAELRDIQSAAQLKDAQRRDIDWTRLSRVQLAMWGAREHLQRADLTDLQKLNMRQELDNLRLEEAHSAADMARARQEEEFYRGVGGKIHPWMNMLRGLVSPLKMPGRR